MPSYFFSLAATNEPGYPFALTDSVSVGGFGPNKAHDTLSLLIRIMSDEVKSVPSTRDLLRNSLLYRQFKAQREEILKHKWYESEKAGHDIGFDRALTDWTIKHRAEWLKRWKKREALAQAPQGERVSHQ